VAFDLFTVGRYEPAIEHLSRALALEPTYLTARYWLAETLAVAGRPDMAVREYLSWLDGAILPGRARDARNDLEAAWKTAGWQAFWQQEMVLVEEEVARPGSVWGAAQRRYTGPWYAARRYARLGKWDRALDCLESAYEQRHHLMATLTLEPLFAPLRAHPRFQKLAQRINAL
jgi:tetratricopeptide (TPR) repeat protein